MFLQGRPPAAKNLLAWGISRLETGSGLRVKANAAACRQATAFHNDRENGQNNSRQHCPAAGLVNQVWGLGDSIDEAGLQGLASETELFPRCTRHAQARRSFQALWQLSQAIQPPQGHQHAQAPGDWARPLGLPAACPAGSSASRPAAGPRAAPAGCRAGQGGSPSSPAQAVRIGQIQGTINPASLFFLSELLNCCQLVRGALLYGPHPHPS